MRILYLQNPVPVSNFPEACLSLTPKIAAYKSMLFLDIEVTRTFFGTENKILENALGLTELFNIDPQLVVTDRPEWAQALAITKTNIFPPGKSHLYLLKLGIDRLKLCGEPNEIENEIHEREDLIAFMKRVGMYTIADFTLLSPLAISRRFGKMGCSLREWAIGERTFTLPTFLPSEPIAEFIDMEEIPNMELLLFSLKQTLDRIEARLCGRGVLAKTLKITFSFQSDPTIHKTFTLSEPLRKSDELLKLLREFLQVERWNSPLLRLEIEISDTVPYQAGQLSLFDDGEKRFSDLGTYVTRLRGRFGENSVGFASLTESYLPERSWKNTWPPQTSATLPKHFPKRPPFLFSSPQPYLMPKNARLTPSETLASEWWDEEDRQYFILETPSNRLWVYWVPSKQHWFLHGMFN